MCCRTQNWNTWRLASRARPARRSIARSSRAYSIIYRAGRGSAEVRRLWPAGVPGRGIVGFNGQYTKAGLLPLPFRAASPAELGAWEVAVTTAFQGSAHAQFSSAA